MCIVSKENTTATYRRLSISHRSSSLCREIDVNSVGPADSTPGISGLSPTGSPPGHRDILCPLLPPSPPDIKVPYPSRLTRSAERCWIGRATSTTSALSHRGVRRVVEAREGEGEWPKGRGRSRDCPAALGAAPTMSCSGGHFQCATPRTRRVENPCGFVRCFHPAERNDG